MTEESFTNQIRRLRFEHGEMTQQQLAEAVGVTRQTILSIESGRYAPSLLLAFRIARAFAEPIDNVFQYRAVQKKVGAKKSSPPLLKRAHGLA
ncbi:MAG TPA: helix-turn-helix transcriptional regulator [Tepidisphaeraceae bacterium]